MRIGDLAAQVGVNPKTIRYYETIGIMPEPARTGSGYRDYIEADVARVVFVKAAQRLEMRLDEIREVLALRDRGERPCDYVRRTLRQQVSGIDQRLAELTRLRTELIALDELADQVADTTADQGSCCPLIEHHATVEASTPTPQCVALPSHAGELGKLAADQERH